MGLTKFQQEKYSMPALFTNQFLAVQNKTCLAIYSIYSTLQKFLQLKFRI